MTHPSRRVGRLPRGFTLIELMIVVTIIGLLASVAIPEFMGLSRRTKQSEREVMITSIIRTVNDYWTLKGTLPGGSIPDLPQNPPVAVDGAKHPFDASVGKWAELNWRPDGHLYFHYSVTGLVTGTTGVLYITAETDLDNNGVKSTKVVTYTLQEGTWQRTTEVETNGEF